jgi:xanthosine utilization system XapX-like protein
MKNKIKIDKYYLLIVLAGSLFGFLFSLLQCPIIKKDILNLI